MNKSSRKTTDDQKILNRAIEIAGEQGWNDEMLSALKQEFGIVDMTRHYPDGLTDLIDAWANWADAEMLRALDHEQKQGPMKIREQIALGVRARLTALAPHKQAFKKSVTYMTHPLRAAHTKKLTWQTADRLWRAAGDTATDYNHYSKRILLSGVLASTTLYWLRDSSVDHERSWAFLDRRINNVLKIGGFLGRLKKHVG